MGVRGSLNAQRISYGQIQNSEPTISAIIPRHKVKRVNRDTIANEEELIRYWQGR